MGKKQTSPIIYVICGPIGCGKSTWAREAAKPSVHNAIIVNDDALVTALHGGDYKLYDKKLKPLYKNVEQNIIGTALCMKRNVVVDRTNPSRRNRGAYFSLANKFGVDYRLVLFEWVDPITSAKSRMKSDSRGYTFQDWFEVANKHFGLYEEPTGLNADKIIRVDRYYGP